MSERTIMNRYSRSSFVALLALVVSIGFLSAGCAISGRTALPELPPVPVLTITTVTVVTPGFTNTIYPPPDGGANLGQIIATAGGTPPLSSCTIVNDTANLFDQLPPGLSIATSGSTNCIIFGTISDTAPLGVYTFVVRVADARGTSATRTYTIEVRVGFLLNSATLGNAKEGTAFGPLNLPTTGGTIPGNLASCSLANGPAGLTVSVSGRDCVLGGSPNAGTAGMYPNFTITATDQGAAGSNSLVAPLVVNDDLVITTTMLPNGTVNTAYSQTLANTGGQTPFTWSISAGPFTGGVGDAGTPCEGLAINAATGEIAGTPLNAGTCSFTARVDDTTTQSTTSNGTFDTTLATNDTQALDIVVDKANSTTTITSDAPDPSVADEGYTVNVSVQGVPGGTQVPTGAVTVSDGLDSCTVAALTPGNPSTGSCVLTSTVIGAKMLTATYSGDANFNGSDNTGAPEPHQVNTRSTSTTVSLNPTSVAVNQATQVTVTVTDTQVNGTASSPGGTVAIMTNDGTDTIGTCTLAAGAPGVSTCTADVTPTQLGTGTRSITASFTATNNKHADSDSTGAPQLLTVTARTTSTVVMLSPATVFVNEGTTVTVTVSDTDPNPPASAPGGTIAILSSDGTDTIGTCTLTQGVPSASQSQCMATLTPTLFNGGSRSITATYTATDGDHANSDSTGAPQILTVNQRTTTSTVMLSPASVLVGEASTITVTVADSAGAGTPVTPSGTVTFLSTVGTDTFAGSCTLAETVPGTASCNTVTVTPNMVAGGTHGITADFAATNNIHANSSGNANLTVNARSTSTAVTLLPTAVFVGETSTATVVVTDTGATGTPSAPSGTVTVVSDVGSDVIGACTLAPSGPSTSSCAAGITPQMVAGGTHNITATFTATDDIHSDSNSNASPQALTVNPRATITALAINNVPPTVFVNESASITVTVSDNTVAGSPFIPGGTITLTSTVVTDVFSACTLAPPPGPGVSATCNATVTPQMVAGGLHNLTASYGPTDDVHTASDSNATPQALTVTPRTTSTSVTLSPASVFINEPSTVTVTVTDTTPNPTPVSPGGTIVILSDDGTDTIAPCVLAAGAPGTSTCMAALTPTQLGTGSRVVTAFYTATDDVHTDSDSTLAPQMLTVNARTTATTVAFSIDPAFISQTTDVMVTVTDTSGGTPSQPGVGTVVTVMSSVGTDLITGTCTLAGATPSTSTCTVQLTPDAPAGPHTVTATFAAAGIHNGSVGSSDLTVNLRTTAVAVTFLKNPIIVNETTDVTVTVTDTAAGTQSQPGVGTNVTVISSVGSDVFVGTCTLAGAAANSSDCTVQITPAVDGTVHVITGTFAATTLHDTSSNTGNLQVDGRPTTTTITLGSGTVVVNEPTSVMVEVTDTGAFGATATPTGTIMLSTSGTGSFDAACNLAETVPNTTAACTVNFTPDTVSGGTHTITATFVATTIHATSNDTDALTVNARTTSTAAALSVATVVVGESTTVTVTVTDTEVAGSPVTPSGTVTVNSDVGSDSITGTCTLAETVPGTAECATVMVTPQMVAGGTHNITASYVATDDVHSDSDSTGTPQALTVNPRSTSTAVSVSPTTVVVNQGTTVTVTVMDTEGTGTPFTPSGTVVVSSDDGTDSITGTCTLAETVPGTATCNTVVVTPQVVGAGTRNIDASYTATDDVHTDSDSTAAPAVLTVNRRQTMTAVTFSVNPVNTGGMTTVTATVMDIDPNGTALTPSGNVAFTSDDAGDAFSGGGMCALLETVPGTASCSVTLTTSATVGTHMITGTFPDSTVHATSFDTQNLTVQDMVLTAFTLTTATENRATTTVSLPILGGTGPFTCMAVVTPSNPGFTVAANGSNCDIDLTAGEGTAGAYTITITATDSGTGSDMKMSGVTIVDDLIIDQDAGFDNAETLANGVSGRTYDTIFTSSGGQGPTFTFSEVPTMTIADDADCTGLTFSMGGTLSGNTNGAGGTNCGFSIRVTDTATMATVGTSMVAFSPAGNYDVALSIGIVDELSITTTALTNALRLSAYGSNSIDATGGLVPANFTWSITAGDFTGGVGNGGTACEGLSLTTTTGASTTIDGTPQNAGLCATGGAGTFTITVSEAASMVGIVTIGAGSDTQDLTIRVFGTFAYVADPANDTVEVIDTTSNTLVTTIALTSGDDPNSVAITPDGSKALVTLEGPDRVAVINTATNTLVTGAGFPINIEAGGACDNPKGIAISAVPAPINGNRAYVACDDRRVAIINTDTNAFVARIDAGDNNENLEGAAFRPDGTRVYFTQITNNELVVVDATTQAQIDVDTVSVGTQELALGTETNPRGIRVVANGANVYAYIAKENPGAGTQGAVDIVDVTNDTIQAGLAIVVTRQTGADTSPNSVAPSADNQRIFVTLRESGRFAVLDNTVAMPDFLTTAPHIVVGTNPEGVTLPPSAARAYMALNGGDAVGVHDDTSPTFPQTITPIALPGAAASTPKGIAHIPIPK